MSIDYNAKTSAESDKSLKYMQNKTINYVDLLDMIDSITLDNNSTETIKNGKCTLP